MTSPTCLLIGNALCVRAGSRGLCSRRAWKSHARGQLASAECACGPNKLSEDGCIREACSDGAAYPSVADLQALLLPLLLHMLVLLSVTVCIVLLLTRNTYIPIAAACKGSVLKTACIPMQPRGTIPSMTEFIDPYRLTGRPSRVSALLLHVAQRPLFL